MPSYDELLKVKVFADCFTGLGLVLSLLRLWIRIRIRRLWWEDACALIASVFGVASVTSEWIYLAYDGRNDTAVAMEWIYMLSCTCIICLLLSVIRIIPSSERLHTAARISVISVSLLWAAVFIEKTVWCTLVLKLYRSDVTETVYICYPTHAMSIFALVADCVAELISVSLPLYMLRNVKLPSRQRRLLRLIFSATVTISLISFVRMLTQVVDGLWEWLTVADDFQIAISLIVCNLLVVATYIYRAMGYTAEESESSSDSLPTDDDFTTTTDQLTSSPKPTTIEFSSSGGSSQETNVNTSPGTLFVNDIHSHV
ncbi:hypothetical protein F5I97DRAFT_28490 [Phlebopus sp. FC_14]|nr:hypothetical protein F5I97DRAFT_28490 [Phlebopus sp. FC_14]